MISKYKFLYRCKQCGYLLGCEHPEENKYCLRCDGEMIFQGIEGEEKKYER